VVQSDSFQPRIHLGEEEMVQGRKEGVCYPHFCDEGAANSYYAVDVL